MKAECWKIDTFELWCWRRLLIVPWTAKRSNQSVLKELSPEYSFEELMLKLKLQYFGSNVKIWIIWKNSDAGKDWRQEENGMTEDDMAGWHHWLDGHEFEQAPGVYSNSHPLGRWCHQTISSSVVSFFSCPQSFPASGSFPMSQLFTSGGQSIDRDGKKYLKQHP